jgi:hypothetical protein
MHSGESANEYWYSKISELNPGARPGGAVPPSCRGRLLRVEAGVGNEAGTALRCHRANPQRRRAGIGARLKPAARAGTAPSVRSAAHTPECKRAPGPQKSIELPPLNRRGDGLGASQPQVQFPESGTSP